MGCRVQCKSHNVVQRRQRIPWINRWIIRGRYVDEAAAVFAVNPLLFEGVKALEVAFQPDTFSEGQLSALLSTLDPSSIKDLVLDQMQLSKHDFSAIAQCANLCHLTYLGAVSPISTPTLREVVSSPHLSRLEHLELLLCSNEAEMDKGAEAASIFSSSPTLSNLTICYIGGCFFGEEAAKSFAASPHLTNVVDLFTYGFRNNFAPLMHSLYGDRMERLTLCSEAADELISMYMNSPERFKSVKQLDISPVSAPALDSVLSSSSRLESVTSLNIELPQNLSLQKLFTCRALHQLKELGLSGSKFVSEEDVRKAFSSSDFQLTRLRSLSITERFTKIPWQNHFSSCPHFSSLVSMDFTDAGFRDAELIALCRSPYFQHLRELHLCQNNDIGVNGWQALGTCTNFPSLITLNLFDNPSIGVPGCSYLKDISLYSTSLVRLKMSDCDLTDDSVAALTENSHLHSLRSLSLSRGDLTLKGFNILGACTSLVGLHDLRLNSSLRNVPPRSRKKLFADSCLTNLTRLSMAGSVLKRIPFPMVEEFLVSSPMMTCMRVLKMKISGSCPIGPRTTGASDRYNRLHSLLDKKLELLQDR